MTDGAQIVNMVEFVETVDLDLSTETAARVNGVAVQTGQTHFYDCKNLRDDGDCGIYETRPMMCREFPYGKPCHIDECTLETSA